MTGGRLLLRICWVLSVAACSAPDPGMPPASSRSALLGPETPVDAPVVSAAAIAQNGAAVASGAGHWLVAWNDERLSFVGSSEVWAGRVSFDGGVLDLFGVPASLGRPGRDPAVACLPDPCLVGWINYSDVFGVRVSAGGAVLSTSPVLYAGGVAEKMHLSAASNGAEVLLAWTDRRTGTDAVWARRVAADGGAAGAEFAVSTGTGARSNPAVVAAGPSQYWVAWSDSRSGNADIYASRVSSAGVVQEASGIQVSSAATLDRNPAGAVALPGGDLLLVWDDQADILGARLSSGGALIDASPFLVNSRAGAQVRPAVAWEGSRWQVLLEDLSGANSSIRTTAVLASGVVGDLNGTLIGGFGETPAIAGAGGLSLGVWNNQHLRAALIEDAGVKTAIPVVTSSANSQFMADVAGGDAGFLVVWDDSRADVLQPAARRFSPTGVAVGSTLLLSAAGAGRGTRVAAGPGQYLVAWSDTSAAVPAIRVSHLGLQGNVLDTVPVGGSPLVDQEGPALAFGPGEYLVAWDEETATNDVFAARVRADGGVSAPFVIANNSLVHELEPAVAGTSTQWLVAWSEVNSIRFTRVGPGGALLDSPPGTVLGVVAARFDASIATNGTDFLVAWFDNYQIAAARILANGTVLDTGLIQLDNSVMPGEAPHAAWDGRRYVVSWQKDDGQVIAQMIPASGPVVLGPPVPLMAAVPRHSRPRMAFGGDNAVLAAHSYERAAPLASARVVTRAINYQPAGGVCTSGFDCLTGICTASVCRLSDGGAGPAPDAGTDGGASADGGDGGSGSDGGTDGGADGGTDGGTDGGMPADAGDGGSDGGAAAGGGEDGGPGPVDPRQFQVGCGCHATAAPAWFGLLAIAAMARRRRIATGTD